MSDKTYTDLLPEEAKRIVDMVLRKDLEYGASWKRRGGVGAYFVMVRKIDRLETQLKRFKWDIFEAIQDTSDTTEPLGDTIDDLIGYLLLIRAEVRTHVRLETSLPTMTLSQICPNCPHPNSIHKRSSVTGQINCHGTTRARETGTRETVLGCPCRHDVEATGA